MMKQLFSITCAAVLLFSGFAPLASYAQDEPELAVFHKKVGKLACKDCHVSDDPESLLPEESLSLANKQCMACHGTMNNVAAKITPKLSNKHINPHAGHVVSIQCVTCHSGHETSEAYCTKCHAFNMPMKVGNVKK